MECPTIAKSNYTTSGIEHGTFFPNKKACDGKMVHKRQSRLTAACRFLFALL
jgi:hypothetical protein